MTISSTQSRISYTGNGVTTGFAFPYLFFQNSDLEVRLVDTSGAVTLMVLNTDYTVTGAGDDAGGTVTLMTAPDVGDKLVINRSVSFTQETDYISGDPFPAETHERALDKLTMQTQQLQEALKRTVQLPITSDADASVIDPAAVKVVAGIASEVAQVAAIQADIGVVVTNITAIQDAPAAAASAASSETAAAASAASAAASAAIVDPDHIVAKTSTTGAAQLPVGTTAQRDVAPQAGDIRFNSDLGKFEGFNGTAWSSVGGGATGGGGDAIFYENDTILTEDYTLNRNASMVGPLEVASGKNLTVADGVRLVVL